MGDAAKAKTYDRKLVAMCRAADTERPELQEARAALTKI
jgi:hypothetical protein